MKRTAVLLFATLAIPACDRESDEVDPRAAAFELDDADDVDDVEAPSESFGRERGHHGKRGHEGRHDPSEKICEAVSCSEGQLEQVKAAFARPERRERRHERPDMSAANAALAEAFAGEGFGEADLKAWAAQLPESPDHAERHLQTLSELHAILSVEQRKALAATTAAGEMFGGRSRGKHEGRGDRRAEEHLCQPLACTDAQKTELAAIFERTHTERPDSAALAAAFVADTFDADAVAVLLGDRASEMQTTVVSVHGVLTAEQRATVAQRIAEQGPRALMGKGGRHGKPGKHGKHGKRRGRRGGDRELAAEGREFG